MSLKKDGTSSYYSFEEAQGKVMEELNRNDDDQFCGPVVKHHIR